jgi:hypothetical protein
MHWPKMLKIDPEEHYVQIPLLKVRQLGSPATAWLFTQVLEGDSS